MRQAWRQARKTMKAFGICKLTACLLVLAICSCAREDVIRPKIGWKMADRRNEIPPYSGHAVRLDTVPRTIVKEPIYRTKPRYCLLVFGSADKTPVWLVEDGDTLYVDRNGDGDLIEPGKAVRAGDRRQFMTMAPDGRPVPYRDLKYRIGSIGLLDGNQHAEFEVIRAQQGDDPPIYVISGLVKGTSKQCAGGSILAPSRESAPILHFGGLLLPEAIRVDHLKLGKSDQELHVRFYTPGVGRNSTVSLGEEAVPANIHPVAEITWPGGSVLESVVTLTQRC